MSSLRIYGIARTRAFRALWVAKELGVDYEHLPIEIGDAGARTPEFLAINPNGRLPVIVDGDFVLFELLAITLYLAKKHSPGRLYPATLEGEARAWQWSLWAVTEVDRGVNIWSLHAVRLPPEERDAAKRAEALKVLEAPFRVLDAAISKQPYLLGKRFYRRRSQRRRRHQPRRRHGFERRAEPEGLAQPLPRSAGGARGAGAEGQGRQRNAGRGDAAHRPDQPPVSSSPAPFNLGQTIQQALALHQQGRLDEAEKLYTRALKAQRDNFDALHLLGMLNHQRGKPAEAHRLIAAALKVQPGSPDALSNLAMVLHALKRDDEALAAIDKALKLAPGHLDALNNRGNILLDLKRPADAIAAFDAVLAKEPRHLQALVNRGNARTELGEPGQALADYDAALAMAPFHPLALYNRGNALRALGRMQEALAAYEQALASAPNHPGAWLNRGIALAAFNRHAEALSSYARLLALQPDNAEAHFNNAMSMLTLGDYPARLCRIRMALEAGWHGRPQRFPAGRHGSAIRRSPARPSCCTPSRVLATP